MEFIDEHLKRLGEMIDQIEDACERAGKSFFSQSKISIDKNEIYEIIDKMHPVLEDMRRDLPNEILQAKRVINEGEKINSEAKSKAAQIIKTAEADAAKLVNQHEITKTAKEQAEEILASAKKDAKELRMGSREYADEILIDAEKALRDALDVFQRTENHFADTINILYENRQELREK